MRKKGRFQCLLCQSPEMGADLSLQQVWLPIEMFCYTEQELQEAQMDALYPHFALVRPFERLPFNQMKDELKYTSRKNTRDNISTKPEQSICIQGQHNSQHSQGFHCQPWTIKSAFLELFLPTWVQRAESFLPCTPYTPVIGTTRGSLALNF